MANGEQEYRERRITYWGLTDGKTTDRWLLSEFDHEALLDNLESRERDADRLVRLPGGRGVLVRVYRRLDEPARILKVFKVEPAGVISLLKGETVEEYDPGDDASMMYPSWVRLHSGNRVALLKGPGGAGKGDLVAFINGVEPAVLDDVPRRRSGSSIGLAAILSDSDRAAIAANARRVNSLSISLPSEEEVHVPESTVSDVITFLRNRLGTSVSVRLHVTATRSDDGAEAASALQQEVGRIVQSPDLTHFRAARMTYDQEDQDDLDLDLLAEVVAARVPVLLGARGVLTDPNCWHALAEAWAQVEARVKWAVAPPDDNGE